MTTKASEILAGLLARGFDASYPIGRDDDGRFTNLVRVRCSQCETMVINGIPCHETGCPHIVRDVTCSHCGDEYRSNQSHECTPDELPHCAHCDSPFSPAESGYEHTCCDDCHRSDDPHCTCNDCIAHFSQTQDAQ